MSLIGDLAANYALILGPTRSIGGIVPDCTMEEVHRDGLIITQHPVEKGVAITDHAFARPAEVDMRIGFSNSSAGDPGYARAVYQDLLALRDRRQPFDVFTGKRAYRRMLIGEIGVTNEGRSENILLVSVRLQQITITSTRSTGGGTGTDTAKPNGADAQQANPASTAGIGDKGQQATTEVTGTSFAGSFNAGVYGSGDGTFAGVGGVVVDSSTGDSATGPLYSPNADSAPITNRVDGMSPAPLYSPSADSAAAYSGNPAAAGGAPVPDIGVSAYNPFGG